MCSHASKIYASEEIQLDRNCDQYLPADYDKDQLICNNTTNYLGNFIEACFLVGTSMFPNSFLVKTITYRTATNSSVKKT